MSYGASQREVGASDDQPANQGAKPCPLVIQELPNGETNRERGDDRYRDPEPPPVSVDPSLEPSRGRDGDERTSIRPLEAEPSGLIQPPPVARKEVPVVAVWRTLAGDRSLNGRACAPSLLQLPAHNYSRRLVLHRPADSLAAD